MLVYPTSTKQFAKNEAGGKGYNLYLMSSNRLLVPHWIVIGKSVFEDFLNSSDIKEKIFSTITEVEEAQISAAEAEAIITKAIAEANLNEETRALIELAYTQLKTQTDMLNLQISVRSSAADEDSGSLSFAGQLSSYLYVEDLQETIECVKQCWASSFSARCISYRIKNKLDFSKSSVAVVLQQMIDPETSGVAFSCDPIAQDFNTFVVSSVYGVGEGLVSGAIEGDTFWLERSNGKIKEETLVTKKEAFRRNANGSCGPVPVEEGLQDRASLDHKTLSKIHKLIAAVEDFYRYPQDIEWAIKDDTVYLLQSRPVTTLDHRAQGFPNLWDNSNIVESYGGLTSPLSFSFALRNYKNVYIQFCEILGIPSRIVREMEEYLGNMLGCIDGRVYYNLYNWYKLVGVLPGFSNNKEFMETMMGVGENLSDEVNERVKPHALWSTFTGKLLKVRTGIAFLNYHFTIQKMVDAFLLDFNKAYQKFRALDYDRLFSDEIFSHYLEMEREMLGQWKAPIINDFLCMVHFGLLKKLTDKWLNDVAPNLQNDLMIGEGNIESAEPTKAIVELAKKVKQNSELEKIVTESKPEFLLEILHQSNFKDFYQGVNEYIDRFGFRCMSEMKLEEKDLSIDPSFLFVCIKNYLNTYLNKDSSDDLKIRREAEAKITENLQGIKQKIYLWSLHHARKALRNRENTRFARTRAYGVARNMFNAMGARFTADGMISQTEDIFYLTIDEIFGIHQGTLTSYKLSEIIDIRKKSYHEFNEKDVQIRFLTRGPVYWKNNYQAVDEDPESGDGFDLKGTPCCPGIITGVVKVILDHSDNLELNGEILVTKRTDPGWVPLYPSLSGLLIERGSLLSHSAIVAREMGLPAIVNIKGLTSSLKSGMRIRIDGGKGIVTILDDEDGKVD